MGFEKTKFTYDSKMNPLDKRPKGQDMRPKCFGGLDAIQRLEFDELTERRILWMLHHYPYLYNAFFSSDYNAMTNSKHHLPDSKYNQGFKLLRILISRGFVYNNPHDHIKTYRITFQGHIHRLIGNPLWGLLPAFAFIAVITFGVLNYTKKTGQPHKEPELNKPTLQTSDSSSKSAAPIQNEKVMDSSSLRIDTTKTRH